MSQASGRAPVRPVGNVDMGGAGACAFGSSRMERVPRDCRLATCGVLLPSLVVFSCHRTGATSQP